MVERPTPAAFYAARGGGRRQWWTVLHPPYTAWHLAYVVIGASVAPRVGLTTLVGALVAFFLAVGVAAHALDEWHGRPLGTTIAGGTLVGATIVALTGAAGIGAYGVTRVGWVLVPFLVAGPLLVVAYDAELFGGIVHSDVGFAVAWGAFPVLTSGVAEARTLTWPIALAAVAAFGLSSAQRRLSTPARMVRRHAVSVSGTVVLDDGSTISLDHQSVLAPVEGALRTLSWSVVVLAAALATVRLT